MKAYSQTITKEEFVNEMRKHQAADNFIKGSYWNKDTGKGCAIGCSLKSVGYLKGLNLNNDNHALYPEYLGIPEWLAKLEDQLFEGMSEARSKTWPVEFAEAINIGADLEKVKTPFFIMILEHSLTSMDAAKYDIDKYPDVVRAIEDSKRAVTEMIRCHREGLDLSSAERSAAWSAESAARVARVARSAESAAYEYYANRLLEMLQECGK